MNKLALIQAQINSNLKTRSKPYLSGLAHILTYLNRNILTKIDLYSAVVLFVSECGLNHDYSIHHGSNH